MAALPEPSVLGLGIPKMRQSIAHAGFRRALALLCLGSLVVWLSGPVHGVETTPEPGELGAVSRVGELPSGDDAALFKRKPGPITTELQDALNTLPMQSPSEIHARAFGLLAHGNQSAAEQLLDAAVQRHPKEVALVFFQAACARSRFDSEGAGIIFLHVLELAPTSPEGQCAALVLRLDSRKDVRENFDALCLLAESHPENPLIRWMAAVECRSLKKSVTGVGHYRVVAEKMNPGPVLFHQTFGNLLGEAGCYDEALAHRKQAALMERASWSVNAMANTLTRLGRFEEARECCDQAMRLNPTDPLPPANMVEILSFMGKHDEIVPFCEGAAARVGDEPFFLSGWGDALVCSGNIEGGLEKYLRAFRANPGNVQIRKRCWQLFCLLGRADEGRKALGMKPPLPSKDADPFIRALEDGDLGKAKEFLAQGRDVNQPFGGQLKNQPLNVAVQNGHVEMVALLLQKGAKPELEDVYHCNAVHYAADFDQTLILRKLLDVGAPVDRPGRIGIRPLHYAILHDNEDAVKLLLEKGADAASGYPLEGSALCLAAVRGYPEIVQRLLDKGAPVDGSLRADKATPLMQTCLYGWPEILLQLLRSGANINARDREGRTPLMWLASSASKPGMVGWLVGKGADVDLEDARGQTALDFAFQRGLPETVRQVLAKAPKRTQPRFGRPDAPKEGGDPKQDLARAIAAPLAFLSEGRFGVVEDRAKVRARERLAVEWSVRTSPQIKEQLDKLVALGDRADCESLQSAAREADAQKLKFTQLKLAEHPAQLVRFEHVRSQVLGGSNTKPADPAAWDFARALRLCELGRVSGLLAPEEADQRSSQCVELLKRKFRSWGDFKEGFAHGARLYDSEKWPRYALVLDMLSNANDPNNPWVRVAWPVAAN